MKLRTTTHFRSLTRIYKPRYNGYRPGSWVKFKYGEQELEGQIWSRAYGTHNWWVAGADGKYYKLKVKYTRGWGPDEWRVVGTN